jgi:hypothetical protein
MLRRMAEPKETAFFFLSPVGWQAEASVFRVNPLQNGGPANSLMAKTNLELKSDATGACLIHFLPIWITVDFTGSGIAYNAAFYPIGSNYEGALVKPLSTPQQFLDESARFYNPKATDLRKLGGVDLKDMARVVEQLYAKDNQFFGTMGVPPLTCQAGAAVYEYTENGVQYRETIVTAIVDARGALASWWNEKLIRMRCPATLASAMQPTFDAVIRSFVLNPEWLANEHRHAAKRTGIVILTGKELSDAARRMWSNWRDSRSSATEQTVLAITDQREYVNPYTAEIERDQSGYNRRWVSSQGDVIFTNDVNYNPTTDPTLWTQDWRKSDAK